MGRQQGTDLLVTHSSSSIALLQERFKQLERMKEMREQKELLRLFPESVERRNHLSHKPSSRRYLNPELSLSPPSSMDKSYAPFRQESQRRQQSDYGDVKSLLSMNLWPTSTNRASTVRSSYGCENNEVDTSLHL